MFLICVIIVSSSGEYLDILAISCDSFNSDVNEKIGRQQGQKNHLKSLRQVREWCSQYEVILVLILDDLADPSTPMTWTPLTE